MDDFYRDTLQKLIKQGVMDQNARALVVCGGETDREVLASCGFRSAVISNLDERLPESAYAPFEWSRQDTDKFLE